MNEFEERLQWFINLMGEKIAALPPNRSKTRKEKYEEIQRHALGLQKHVVELKDEGKGKDDGTGKDQAAGK